MSSLRARRTAVIIAVVAAFLLVALPVMMALAA
jgi:hypothetical protein